MNPSQKLPDDNYENCPHCGLRFLDIDIRFHYFEENPIEDFMGCADCLVKRTRERGWESICPPLYRKTDPERLNQDALKRVREWSGNDGLGMVLVGSSGLGKTRLAFQALRQRFDAEMNCFAVSGVRFAQASADAFFNDETVSRKARSILAKCESAEVLLFDDLGKERLTERVQTNLYALLEARTGNLRPTIFTTNLQEGELGAAVSAGSSEPIIRRIVEFSDVIQF